MPILCGDTHKAASSPTLQYVSITWFQMLLAVCTAVVMALSALPTICAVALVTSPSAWSWS